MRCGICQRSGDWDVSWLPLVALSANVDICESSSRLILKQSFSNPTDKPVAEADYHFPIYEGAVIVSFTCKIDERIIEGVIRDKHTARKLYEKAKEQGQKAALSANPQPDLWTTKISNIPANGKVEVEITVSCELKHDSQIDGIRFALPTNIADRYGSPPENLPSSISTESRGIEIMVAVTMASPITSLQSPSHPIEVGMGTHTTNKSLKKEEFDPCKGYVNLSQKDTALDSDFVLYVKGAGIAQPQAIVETHPTVASSRALMLSLVPKFQMPRIKPEIVFIADRSGSMEENISQLKSALKVFLKSLPVGVKFNICSFGSEHSFLWPKSVPYDQDSLDTALKYVETFAADFGGTEMFPPIEEALKNRYKDLETEIFVLTDGEIWDTEPLFNLIQAECETNEVRVFSLGIGESVSHHLVEGLARAGRGYAQIVGTKDKLDAKVVRMLKASLGAHVKDYQLVFPDSTLVNEDEHEQDYELVESAEGSNSTKTEPGQSGNHEDTQKKPSISLYDPTADNSSGDEVKGSSEDRYSHLPDFEPPRRLQTPHRIPPLYPFSRTNIYILLSGSEATPHTISLRGTTTSGVSLALEVPVKDVGKGTTLHQLAAKNLLQELDEGRSYLHSGKFGVDPKDEGKFMDWIEREGVRIGTTFGVAGKWTSFVAVEKIDGLEDQLNAALSGKTDASKDQLDSIIQLFSFDIPEDESAELASVECDSRPKVQYMSPCVPQSLVLRVSGHAEKEAEEVTACCFSDLSEAMVAQNLVQNISTLAMAPGQFSARYTIDAPGCAETGEDGDAPGGAEVVDDNVRKTYALVGMQAFDGSFPSGPGGWVSKLAGTFKQWTQQQHEVELAQLRTLNEDDLKKLLASAAAISIFHTELKDYEDVWEMVVEKTDSWGVEKVGEAAWSALKSWVNQQVLVADDSEKQNFWDTPTQ